MEDNRIYIEKLNKEYKIILTALFNFVIPPSSDKKMPGAGLLCNIDNAIKVQDFSLFEGAIIKLNDNSRIMYSKEFSKLSSEEAFLIIEDFKNKSKRNFNSLVFKIINYYYTSNLVLEAIGIKSQPPFPDGNYVIEGDLLIFEGVYLRGEIYRKCKSNQR